jgi:uncharacterized protein YcnI
MNTRTTIKASIALGAGALLAVAVPLAASAHVTVSPYTAEPGAYALVTFKVPNESGTATTDQVEIDIPESTPFPDVSYVPVTGWTAQVVTSELANPIRVEGNEQKTAVSSVIFTADAGTGIQNGQLQLFQLSVGPVPDTGRVYLPTTQTYSDGTVVKWDQKGTDAEHPSPVLYVNDAPVVSDDADAEVTAASQAELAPAGAAAPDVLARGLGIGGLVVGAVGVVLAIVAGRRRATGR